MIRIMVENYNLIFTKNAEKFFDGVWYFSLQWPANCIYSWDLNICKNDVFMRLRWNYAPD